jgi:hypothetical protein
MPAPAKKPVTTPIPVQLSESEVNQFILPYLSMLKREPTCKLGYHRVFNLILWMIYTAMQWKGLPVPTDHDGEAEKPLYHPLPHLRQVADDESMEHAFVARVGHLSEQNQLDLSVLHGDGIGTMA